MTSPGRGEVFSYKNFELTLYGSHNLDGMRQWVKRQQYQSSCPSWDLVLLAFSKRAWPDLKAMIKLWERLIKSCPSVYKKVLLCSFEHTKAWKPNASEKLAVDQIVAQSDRKLFWSESWRDFESFLTIKQDQQHKPFNILVIGSYYFVSTCRDQLAQK